MQSNQPQQDKDIYYNETNKTHPLDRILQHKFQFPRFNFKLDHTKDDVKSFLKNNSKFYDQMVQYFMNMIQDVCSATFELFINNICNQGQAKNYASKNILQNLMYFCRELSKKIRSTLLDQNTQRSWNCKIMRYFDQFKKKYLPPYLTSPQSVEQQQQKKKQKAYDLTLECVYYISEHIEDIVEQISEKYPSNPFSSYSLELKKQIRPSNSQYDHSFGFLYPNQLMVKATMKDTSRDSIKRQIMQFINKAIQIPFSTVPDQNLTYFQVFLRLNKHFVWIIAHPKITKEAINKEKCLVEFLVSPAQNMHKIYQKYKDQSSSRDSQDQKNRFIKQMQEAIYDYQKNHKFIASTKIPQNTQKFDQIQLENIEFKIKHPSILRILTKWIQDIKKQLQNSEKSIRDNGNQFKNIYNKHVDLKVQQRNYLYQEARDYLFHLKQKEVKKNINNPLIADLLIEEHFEFPTYRFQQSLKFSSRINTYIIKETLQELIDLIQNLFKIPQKASQKMKNSMRSQAQQYQFQENLALAEDLKNVNLVCNRIGDLLRSKIFCTQSQFIDLFALFDQLDSFCRNQQKPLFRLLRVKDKLKDPINNVLVNFMLYQKIKCQIQICFDRRQDRRIDKRIEKMNCMHHYMYELKRGPYGTIPELAHIIYQKDSISIHHQSSNLVMKKFPTRYNFNRGQQRTYTKSEQQKKVYRCIYKRCHQFSLEGGHKFIQQDGKNYCIFGYQEIKLPKKTLFMVLTKLKYDQQHQWVRQIMKNPGLVDLQQIKKNIAFHYRLQKGLYLTIYPTDKQVVVQFQLIYFEKNYKILFAKSFDEKIMVSQVTEKMFQDHQKRNKFYFKVDKEKLIKFFKESKRQSDKQNASKISDQSINKIKLKGIQQYNKILIKDEKTCKKKFLNVNNRKQIAIYLEQQIEYFTQVQTLFASGTNISNINAYNRLVKLQQLYLSGNEITGQVQIQNFIHLTLLDLSNNKITKISLRNMNKLNQLRLNKNKIRNLQIDQLPKLECLNLQQNLLGKSFSLSSLKFLKQLNLKYNQIEELDLRNCIMLQTLVLLNKKKPTQNLILSRISEAESQQGFLQHGAKIAILFNKMVQLKRLFADGTLIVGEGFRTQKFQQLILCQISINPQNIDLIEKKQFPSLRNLSLTVQSMKRNQNKLTKFLQKLNYLDQISLILTISKIESLDLRSVKNIKDLEVNKMKELKIYSAKTIRIFDEIQHLLVEQWSNISQFQAKNINFMELSPTYFENMNKIIIKDVLKVKGIKMISSKSFKHLQEAKICCMHPLDSIQVSNNDSLKTLSLIFNAKTLSIKECKILQQLTLQQFHKTKSIEIELFSLEKLSIKNSYIESNLTIKLSSTIKRIYLDIELNKMINFSLQQNETQLNLNEMYLKSLNLQALNPLFTIINKVKTLIYYFKPKQTQLRLSKICKKIVKLHLKASSIQYPLKVIVDRPVKTVIIPNVKILSFNLNEPLQIEFQQGKEYKLDIFFIDIFVKKENFKENEKSIVIFNVSKDRIHLFRKGIRISSQNSKYVQLKIVNLDQFDC